MRLKRFLLLFGASVFIIAVLVVCLAPFAVPVGLLVTNILVINNLRDLPTDRVANKMTLAVRLGDKATRIQYALFVVIAYALPLVLAIGNASHRWLLMTWFTLPLAIGLTRNVLGGMSGRDLNPVLKRTGQLLLFFGEFPGTHQPLKAPVLGNDG